VRLTLQDTTENPHTSGQLFQKTLLHVDKFPLEYFQPFLGLRYLNFPPVPFFWFLQDKKQFYVIIIGSFWIAEINLIFIHPRRKLFWFICKRYVKDIVVRSFRLARENLIFINTTKSSKNHTVCYSKLDTLRHVQCQKRTVLHFIYATLQHVTLPKFFLGYESPKPVLLMTDANHSRKQGLVAPRSAWTTLLAHTDLLRLAQIHRLILTDHLVTAMVR